MPFPAIPFDPLALPQSNASRIPAPFDQGNLQRFNRKLGDHAGLTHFGVVMTRIAPGGQSSYRHAHSHQDEFVMVLSGTPTLETDAGRSVLASGMCVGFPAGDGNAHRFLNETADDVVLLVIGDRTKGDAVTYPDIDLHGQPDAVAGYRFTRKSGEGL